MAMFMQSQMFIKMVYKKFSRVQKIPRGVRYRKTTSVPLCFWPIISTLPSVEGKMR